MEKSDINVEFKFTKPFLNSTTPEFIDKIQSMTLKCLEKFPELHPEVIKFSYTKNCACAMTLKATEKTFNIGYNPEYPIYYHVLGHELMHFAQTFGKIPHGEKSCDVYTLARSELFTDRFPGYIHISQKIFENWSEYAIDIHNLCIQATEVRKTNKQYIKWVTKEIQKLI